MKTTAIVLAAGQGKRMGSDVAKQYLLLHDRPVLYYTLRSFEESPVDEIILVTGEEQITYCKKEIVEKFGFQKVKKIVAGGRERYHSVAKGLEAAQCDYVLIHDGARPFVTPDMIKRGIEAVQQYDACIMGMPVKDTIKISDEEGFAADTPNRNLVWQIQTPQIFSFQLIKEVYEELILKEEELKAKGIAVTDDAMVVELFSGRRVKLVEGSYDNIKLTTPDDLKIAEAFLENYDLRKPEII